MRQEIVLTGRLAAAMLFAFECALAGAQEPTATPDPVVTAVTTAETQLVEMKTEAAKETLSSVMGRAQEDARVALAVGRLLEQEKRYPESVTQLQRAVELAPTDPAPRVALGETYLRMDRADDAAKAFTVAEKLARALVEGDPANFAARYELGISLQRLRRYDDAIEQLAKAREIDPSSTLAVYQLGVTRAFQKKWAEAVQALSQAIDSDSGMAYAYYYRALAQDKLGKRDQLVVDMGRFLSLAPNAPEAERAAAILKAAKR